MKHLRALDQKARGYVPIAVWRRLFPKSSVCVLYHMVSDAPLPHLKHYRYLGAAEFDDDVTYLKEQFGFITYDEMLQRRIQENSFCDNAATLTFDDGFAQCATVVQPILLRHAATCIFFVITDLIDNRVMFRESQASLCIEAIYQRPVEVLEAIIHELELDAKPPASVPREQKHLLDELDRFAPPALEHLQLLLRWLVTITPAQVNLMDRLCDRLGVDVHAYLAKNRPYLSAQQIMQLHSNGFTIGAHSCSHPRLQELSLTQAEYEIVESCRIIRDLTGQKSVPFAFPWSGADLDRAWLEQIRRKYDFVGLFFDAYGFRPDVRFVVQRIKGERPPGQSIGTVLHSYWSSRLSWHHKG